jgi:hypothetical protein
VTATRPTDDQLCELIAQAYEDVHLPLPLGAVETAGRRRRRRSLLVAATAGVAAVAIGTWVTIGSERSASPLPGDQPSTSASVAPGGKPPRPTSSATTATGRCADYALTELARAETVRDQDRTSLPPLRFNLVVIDGQLNLLLYANDAVEVACWLTADGAVVNVNSSDLTTNRPVHTAGQLSNSSSAHGQDPFASYTFGRTPPGTRRVDVHFSSGETIHAQIANDWYVAWAAGEPAYRFDEITKIVAYTAEGKHTLPVTHG